MVERVVNCSLRAGMNLWEGWGEELLNLVAAEVCVVGSRDMTHI